MGITEEKKEKIVVSEDQAEDIKRALDFYYRFLAGQYEVLAMDYKDLLDEKDRYGRKPTEIAAILKQIRARTIPELAGLSLYGSYSAGCSECNPHAGIAYDLCREFWYRRAWFLHPEGGTTIDFNRPRHVDNDPCPAPFVSYSFTEDGNVQAEISACRTQFLVIIDALRSYFRLLSCRYTDLFWRISDDPEVMALAGRLEEIYAGKRKKIPQGSQDLQKQFAEQLARTADAIGEKLEGKEAKSCAFTGHRPQNLPFGFRENDERCTALKAVLKEQIVSLIANENVTHFISGMALGVDMYAAEIVLDLKKVYPDITLECAIPCESQPDRWSEAMRRRYYDIVTRCDKETILQAGYTADCMDKRNRYMADHADFMIAVWDGKPSGTGKTVRYARNSGKVIIRIDPAVLTVQKL